MPPQDAEGRRAGRLRRVNVHVLAHRDDGATDDARAGDAQQQAERHDDLRHAGADDRHDHDQDDQVGEAHPRIDEALQHEVELAAEIARDDAEEDRDDRGDASGTEADDDRELGAVEAAREHVAAEIVGAEWERPGRRLQPVERRDLVHAVGRQHVGEDPAEQEQHEHDRAGRAQRLLAEQAADEVQHRPALAARRDGQGGLRYGRHQRYLTLGSSRP